MSALENENPYVYHGPVTGNAFFGRERELGEILRFLGTKPPQSVSIYGEYRIGKSSLLRQLAEVNGPQRLSDHHFIYVDMQRVFTPQDLLRRVMRELGHTPSESPSYEEFEDAVYEHDKIIVLCLDELGKVLDKPAFDDNFFDFFRSIAQSGKLALVVSTPKPLSQMEIPSGANVSRFFNIFKPLRLGPLTDEEACRLVEAPARKAGRPFTEEEVRFVLEKADHHPLKIQVLCYRLFKAKAAGQVDLEAVWQEAEREIQELLTEKPKPEGAALRPLEERERALGFDKRRGSVSFSLVAAGLLMTLAAFLTNPLFFWIGLFWGTGALLAYYLLS